MSNIPFGMSFSRPENDIVPVIGADFSKALLIETSEDAEPATYPLDTFVRMSSGDPVLVDRLGSGALRDAVRGVSDQLQGLNRGADIVVCRVAEGETELETMANIVAVLERVSEIPSKCSMTPRLVWAGRTTERIDMDTSNPVVAALPAALETLLAVAPVDVDPTDRDLAIDARETMTSQRMIPVGIQCRVYEGEDLVQRSLGPRIVGLFIRVDQNNEGKPFDPIANRPIYGIAGLSRDLAYTFLNPGTEGQQLLEANVSIVAQGEVGVDGSVADGGFYFIGTDNADTGELWEQFHQVRGADYINVKLMQITREFLGRKITADMVEAYVNSIRFMLRDHQAADDILGYNRDVFIPDQNSPEQIRAGRIKLDLGIEPAPVFKLAVIAVRRYRPAVSGLVAEIVSRLNRV